MEEETPHVQNESPDEAVDESNGEKENTASNRNEIEEEEDEEYPLEVMYCEVCGLPPEFCEFGPDFDGCIPWLKKYAPEYSEKGAMPESSKKKKLKKPKTLQGDDATGPKQVTISKAKRGNKKWVTSVEGLSKFGVNLRDATQAFKKQLGAGATMDKKNDRIDVQGDVTKTIGPFLQRKYKIKESDISFVKKTGKVKSRGGGNTRPKGAKGKSRAARAVSRATSEK